MAHRTRGRARGDDKNTIWTALVLSDNISTTVLGFNLVEDADWSVAGSQKTATILSVKGWLTFTPLIVGGADILGYIGVQDEDIVTERSPLTAPAYVNEDIMFTLGASTIDEAVTGFDMPTRITDFGKATRKIKTGQELRIVLASTAVLAFRVSGVLRTLLKLNNG